MAATAVRAATARSLLVAVLGEYVHPVSDGGVWTRTLLRALGELGVQEKTARQVLARAATSGFIEGHREGRAVRWTLTEFARRRFSEVRPLNAHLMRDEPIEATWALLLVTVPGDRQPVRHRLWRRLTASGWGSVGGGTWLGVSPRCEIGLDRILDELELTGHELLLRGELARPHVEQLVARAWDLDSINERYRSFTERFGTTEVETDADAFRACTHMVEIWHRSFLSDPHLPTTLLPDDWWGARARAVSGDRYPAWRPQAARHWRSMGGPDDSAM